MAYSTDVNAALVSVLERAMSLLRSGETDAEVFGVDPIGVADDVVIVMLRGDDFLKAWPAIQAVIGATEATVETHDFGRPENN